MAYTPWISWNDSNTSNDTNYDTSASLSAVSPVFNIGGRALDISGNVVPGLDAIAPSAANYGTLAGAGISAAGQTVGTLAQIIAQSQARQNALEQAGLDRGSTNALAKMKIHAAAEMADKERAQQSQNMLLQALLRRNASSLSALDNKRSANSSGASLLAQAYT